MKLQHSLLAAALLAAASTSAYAQSSTGVVTLGGTIVPSSCTITLANGGLADFGQVPFSTLSPTAPVNLTPININATFECTGPSQFVFTTTDNRHSAAQNSQFAQKFAYGIGSTSTGTAIGMYTIDMNTPIVDSAAGTVIASSNLSTWSAPGTGTGIEKANDATSVKFRGFGATATGPVALTQAKVNFRITPNIRSTQQLQLTQDAVFDGSTTLEIEYL